MNLYPDILLWEIRAKVLILYIGVSNSNLYYETFYCFQNISLIVKLPIFSKRIVNLWPHSTPSLLGLKTKIKMKCAQILATPFLNSVHSSWQKLDVVGWDGVTCYRLIPSIIIVSLCNLKVLQVARCGVQFQGK